MKQTQRSSTASRTRGLIQSETLENRRLFAGMPFGHGEFGRSDFGHGDYGHGGFGHSDFALPPGAGRLWADGVVLSLPFGGQMRLTNTGVSTTATSSGAGAAITAAVIAADGGTAAQLTVPVTVSTTTATRAAAIIVTTRDTPAADPSNADLVQQITPDPALNAPARSFAAGPSIDATATTSAVENGAVFGPFTLGPVTLGPAATPAARPMQDGFGSLLTLNPDAVDRSLRWQSQDATYRPRRAASPTATTEEISVDLSRAAAAATVEQAGFAPVAAEMATRPMWQRVAAIAAGGLLVAANVVVRRRRAQQAGTLARR